MGQILINTGPSSAGWHEVEEAIHCPRLWVLRRRHGDIDHVEALARGSIVHVGLAHYYARYKEVDDGRDPDAYYPPLEAMDIASREYRSLGAKLLPLCQKAVSYYAEKFRTERFTFIVAVEKEYEIRVGSERYTARVDLHVQDRGGKHWFIDHKTSSKLRTRTSLRYTISGQILGLGYIGSTLFGHDFAGVRLNLLEVSANPKAERVTPDPAPGLFHDFPLTLIEGRRRMAQYQDSTPEQVPPASSELVCMTVYGACSMLERCQWGTWI